MKTSVFLILSVFLIGLTGYSDNENREFAHQLKADGGPLCKHFSVKKNKETFCLEDPNSQHLYQFEYSFIHNKKEGVGRKQLIFSVYNFEKNKFQFKMKSELSSNGYFRAATMSDPKLYSHTWSIDQGVVNSDEAVFQGMILLDLGYQEAKRSEGDPRWKFLMDVYRHLGMTSVARQKLLQTNQTPDNQQQ